MPQRAELQLPRLLLEIAAGMAAAELLTMAALYQAAPHASILNLAALNAVILVILVGPLLLWRTRRLLEAARQSRPPRSQMGQHRALGVGLAVWGIGLTISVVGGWQLAQQNRARTQSQFELEASTLDNAVQARFQSMLPALRGIRSTIHATGTLMDHPSFERWVAARDVNNDVPGVRGLGFIERVARPDLPAFLARRQADHAPEFKVRTSGSAADLLIIRNIEPLARNRAALGYDVGSEPVRRAAAEQAIDTGEPSLTGQIKLVQDGQKRAGYLIYLPVYRRDHPIDTVEQRRAALIGLAYSPVVVEELLIDVIRPLSKHLHVDIYDGMATAADRQIFGTTEHDAIQRNTPTATPQFHHQLPLQVGQRQLLVDIHSTPSFEAEHATLMPLWFGVISALLSTLTAFTAWLLAVGRSRAEAIAETQTKGLQQAKAEAESALRDVQALFDTLNRFCQVSVTDRHGVIQHVNDGYCQVSGFSREELIGQTHQMVSSHIHPASYWTEMWQTISAGLPWQGEICGRAKDGHTFWSLCMIAPHTNAQGEVDKYVAIRMDITPAKLLEQERQDINQRLALATEGGSDGLWDWMDVRTDRIWWSPQFYRLLGYQPGELPATRTSFEQMLHPEDRAHALQAMDASLTQGVPFDVEYRLATRNGSYRWFRARAKVYRNDGGAVHRMAGAIQDIHERRLAEFELADRVAQMKAIFSLSKDGFVAFDETGQVSYVSPAFEVLTGIPFELAMEANEFSLFAMLVSQSFGDTAATSFAELPRTLDMRPPANGKLAVQWNEGHGAVSKMLHLHDVTQEAELDQMKSTFMSMAAHELRTPMASIYGFTELLLTRELKPAKQRDLLQRIMRQSESMIDIINELLDLSRLEARLGRDFEMEEVWLPGLLEEVVRDYKVPDGREPPEVITQGERCCILVDAHATRQAVLNVLSNAYKYSPRGGDVTIKLHTPTEAAGLCGVTIRDQGIGMTPEQLSRVGERFYRADKSGNIPGTGLGMAIVTGSLALMGGSLEIDSTLGEGTAVTMWFPLALHKEPQADTPTSDEVTTH